MSKTAFIFPGQGSQTVGMLAELAESYPEVESCFSEASEVLGYDLWTLVQQGPETALNETHRTQPALLSASVAIWRILENLNVTKPSFLAGHSLGEYSALVCAGVIAFKDAIKLVEQRGKFMQQAVPAGTGAMMAIIGLADTDVVSACQQASDTGVVEAVNFNSPGQVVIAGSKDAVSKAGVLCKEAGAKRALPLPVSVPSHCALMKPAAEQLAALLETITFNSPSIPVINNVDVQNESSPEAIKSALIRQLYSPVRWTESVQYMSQQGVERVAEVGAGKVLTGLSKRIDKTLEATSVNTVVSVTALVEENV